MSQAEDRDSHENSHLEADPADDSNSRAGSRCTEGGVCHHSSCCDALADTLANDDQIRPVEEADSPRGVRRIAQEADIHFHYWARRTVDPGDSRG